MSQEIGALNREKNAITHPVSQIPGCATATRTGQATVARNAQLQIVHNCQTDRSHQDRHQLSVI